MVVHDASPAARALLVLEMIQNAPGITADRLAERLGLSDRAIRRHVGILREAGIPVESTRGRYGGYRVGRGLRLPPLMFTPTEALGLVMAVLEGHPAGEDDPVGQALGKIVRALPEPLARPADAVRRVPARGWHVVVPDVDVTLRLVQASDAGERVRLRYGHDPGREWDIELDPWAVVVRHRRWYVLGWSHDKGARRVLRVDRVKGVEVLPERFERRPAWMRSRPSRSSSRWVGSTPSRSSSTLRSTSAGTGCRAASAGSRRWTSTPRAWSPPPTSPSGTPRSSPICRCRSGWSARPRSAAAMDELGRRLLAAAEE